MNNYMKHIFSKFLYLLDKIKIILCYFMFPSTLYYFWNRETIWNKSYSFATMLHQLRGKLRKINIVKSDGLPCRDIQHAAYDFNLGGWVFFPPLVGTIQFPINPLDNAALSVRRRFTIKPSPPSQKTSDFPGQFVVKSSS